MALMAIYGERVATGFDGSVSTWRVPIVVEELLMLAMRGVEKGERMHQHGGRVIVAFAIIGAMFTGVSAAAQQTLSWPERNLTSFASCDYDAGFLRWPNSAVPSPTPARPAPALPLRHHRPQPPVPPVPAVQIHRLPPLVRCSGLNEGHQAHSRTPVLLRFLVRLPSVTATGRWRERGRMRRR